jgi:hypothetical protein
LPHLLSRGDSLSQRWLWQICLDLPVLEYTTIPLHMWHRPSQCQQLIKGNPTLVQTTGMLVTTLAQFGLHQGKLRETITSLWGRCRGALSLHDNPSRSAPGSIAARAPRPSSAARRPTTPALHIQYSEPGSPSQISHGQSPGFQPDASPPPFRSSTEPARAFLPERQRLGALTDASVTRNVSETIGELSLVQSRRHRRSDPEEYPSPKRRRKGGLVRPLIVR